jgi:hypothetical protein
VIGDALEHAQWERQLLRGLHVPLQGDERRAALLDQDIYDPVLLLLVLDTLHRRDREPLAQAVQRVVGGLVAELFECRPTVRLLRELVGGLLDRLLKRALFRKQPEHHA